MPHLRLMGYDHDLLPKEAKFESKIELHFNYVCLPLKVADENRI